MSLSNRGRRLSVAPLAGVERLGRGSLGSGSLAMGYRTPTLSREPIPYLAYSPTSFRGKALEGEVRSLLDKGAIELAPLPSPGYYSRLFVVMKASGAWRPVIDLSLLNLKVQKTSFKMETLQSVLLSVRAGDWMVSLDLKDAYLQAPMHLESRKFLRFVASGKVYQFKVLCFGLSTAQVFTRVMAPVSIFLHRTGIRLRRYLLPGAGSPCSGDSAPALQVVRDSRQLGEVSADSNSADGLPWSAFGLNLFQGFSCPEESREASLNWQRILVLRKAACVILAGASGSTVLHDSAHSGGTIADEITPVYSPEVMGSGRSDGAGGVESRDSRRSRMVAESRSFGSGYRSRSGVPSARLVVRRLGRGLGGASGRRSSFRPVGSGGVRLLHKHQRASGYRESSSLLRFSDKGLVRGDLCGRLDSHCLSSKSRGNQISSPKCYSSAHLEVVRDSSGSFDSTIYHGSSQCARGLVISSQSGARVRMDSQD